MMITVAELLIIISSLIMIGYPLFVKKEDEFSLASNQDEKKAGLINKKDFVLLSLRELEDDFRAGKISEEDYKKSKTKFNHDAISLLKAIDGKKSAPIIISQAIKQEVMLESNKEKAFCRECGIVLNVNDKFCFKCGAKVEPT